MEKKEKVTKKNIKLEEPKEEEEAITVNKKGKALDKAMPQSKKKKPAAVDISDFSESEDGEEKKPAKEVAKKNLPKKETKPQKQESSSESDEEEEEKIVPKKQAKPKVEVSSEESSLNKEKPAPKKKKVEKESSSESEEEKPKAKKSIFAKKPAKKSSSESSESEEEKPKKAEEKKSFKSKKELIESSSPSEDEKEQIKLTQIKKVKAKKEELDSESESMDEGKPTKEAPKLEKVMDAPVKAAPSQAILGEEEKVELFVGNLPFNVDDDMIGEFFCTYGTVNNIKILRDSEGNPKGIAFVKFANHEECAKALTSANGAMLGGRPLRVNYSGEKAAGGARGTKNDQTVFVGNIPFTSTKESLTEFFKQSGEVSDVRIPLREDGKLRGFAHVEFTTTEAAKEALKLNGAEMEGRPLKVDVAGSKPPSASGSSRGGFGGSRGGLGGPRGGFGERRGGFRGAPRGGPSHNKGVIEDFKGTKTTFDDE